MLMILKPLQLLAGVSPAHVDPEFEVQYVFLLVLGQIVEIQIFEREVVYHILSNRYRPAADRQLPRKCRRCDMPQYMTFKGKFLLIVSITALRCLSL